MLIRPFSVVRIKSIPLGIAHIASYIKQRRKDIAVKIVDNRVLRYSYARLLQAIGDYKPDIIGISALTIEAKDTHELARRIKEKYPSCHIVIGGAYPSGAGSWCMEDVNIDFIVQGEGESAFFDLVSCLEQGKKLGGLAGISFRNNGKVIRNELKRLIVPLDSLPYPDLESLDIERYFHSLYGYSHNVIQKEAKAIPILTSRGCPHQCIYCHDILGKAYRAHSPGYVINYISYLVDKFGAKEIQIIDDTFNLDIERAKEICRLIITHRLKIDISFPNGIRPDCIDDELLDLFKEAGVFRIIFGIESGDRTIQEKIKKNLNLEVAEANIIKAAKRKFHLSAFFMLGFPGEKEFHILNTINYARRLPIQIASFHYVVPFPGSRLEQYVPPDINLKEIFFNSDADYHASKINISGISAERLFRLKKIALRSFYFNWYRIVTNILRTPRKTLLLRNLLTILKWAFTERR